MPRNFCIEIKSIKSSSWLWWFPIRKFTSNDFWCIKSAYHALEEDVPLYSLSNNLKVFWKGKSPPIVQSVSLKTF